MSNYKLAIEFKKCDEEIKKYCITRLSNRSKCVDLLNNCIYPMVANPLCTCKDKKKCHGSYHIRKYKDKVYIFYKCNSCPYMVRDIDEAIKTILEPLDSKYIYWGKDLDKLVSKVIGNKKEKKDETYDDIVEYLTCIIKSVNPRM